MGTKLKKEEYEPGMGKKMTYCGENKKFKSYLIPIDQLYYNNYNGRIATYASEHGFNEQNLSELLNTDRDRYNEILVKWVIESAQDGGKAFKKTKASIKEETQKVPGVVLDDGRIVDGNRRFAALNKLYNETGNLKFHVFDAVILEAPGDNDDSKWKAIKRLELNLQNEDKPVDYHRVDFLASFYRDTMNEEAQTLNKQEYCSESHMSSTDYDKNKKVVEIMLEYLEFINKPKAFHIIKKEKLDGPLEEFVKVKKELDIDDWNEKKITFFTFIAFLPDGDRTRLVRDLHKDAKKNGKLFTMFKDIIDKNLPKLWEGIKQRYAYDNPETYNEIPDERTKAIEDARMLIKDGYYEVCREAEIDKLFSVPSEKIKRMIKIAKEIKAKDIKISSSKNEQNEFKQDISELIEILKNLLDKLNE